MSKNKMTYRISSKRTEVVGSKIEPSENNLNLLLQYDISAQIGACASPSHVQDFLKVIDI